LKKSRRLLNLVNEYGLAHIIDLRDEVEVMDYPDPVIEGVQYHHLIVWTTLLKKTMEVWKNIWKPK